MTKETDKRKLAGWIAVSLSILITALWAFWGIVENFHEGWYYESLLSNVGLMFMQYLSPMLIFMILALTSVHSPRLGGALHVVLALVVAWFFQVLTNTVIIFLILPLLGIGLLYWFGRPEPRRTAFSLIAGLPILVLILAGIEPFIRVSGRLDDGNLEARTVHGNGIDLVWAPDGPGWPRSGSSWSEAEEACRRLSDDGLALAQSPESIWRLPAVDEAVRSMARHGRNSGGVWDPVKASATYQITPDKESPLWNVHSQVIYWWTATEVDAERAFMIAYNGRVWSREKDFGPDYLGFRCVRSSSSR